MKKNANVVVLLIALAACEQSTNAKLGQKVVLSEGDDVTVGTLRVDAASSDDGLVVRMQDSGHYDKRHVSGNREVKFGTHRVRFDESGAKVAVTIRAYTPASPLTSEDALLVADEAMSPRSQGPVDCTSATLSPDGATFAVRCRDTALDTSVTFTVDRTSGVASSP